MYKEMDIGHLKNNNSKSLPRTQRYYFPEWKNFEELLKIYPHQDPSYFRALGIKTKVL